MVESVKNINILRDFDKKINNNKELKKLFKNASLFLIFPPIFFILVIISLLNNREV